MSRTASSVVQLVFQPHPAWEVSIAQAGRCVDATCLHWGVHTGAGPASAEVSRRWGQLAGSCQSHQSLHRRGLGCRCIARSGSRCSSGLPGAIEVTAGTAFGGRSSRMHSPAGRKLAGVSCLTDRLVDRQTDVHDLGATSKQSDVWCCHWLAHFDRASFGTGVGEESSCLLAPVLEPVDPLP